MWVMVVSVSQIVAQSKKEDGALRNCFIYLYEGKFNYVLQNGISGSSSVGHSIIDRHSAYVIIMGISKYRYIHASLVNIAKPMQVQHP